LTSFY